jgi:hypothetical protein
VGCDADLPVEPPRGDVGVSRDCQNRRTCKALRLPAPASMKRELTVSARSTPSERMRRSRERRRLGGVSVSLEVGSHVIVDLVALGWLSAPDRADKDALAAHSSI